MSRLGRLKALEERAAARRQVRTERNRARAERLADEMTASDRELRAEMRRVLRDPDPARLAALDAAWDALADLPEVCTPHPADVAEEAVWAWWRHLQGLPLDAVEPSPPPGARDYLAADLARWEAVATRPDLTPDQAFIAQHSAAHLRECLRWAR